MKELKDIANAVYHLLQVKEQAERDYACVLECCENNLSIRIEIYANGRLVAGLKSKAASSVAHQVLMELRHKLNSIKAMEQYVLDGNFKGIENVYNL